MTLALSFSYWTSIVCTLSESACLQNSMVILNAFTHLAVMPVADWALRILHWWWEANTHQTMSFDLELAQTQLSSSLTHSSGCWKAIIYDRFRQKFLACQSHPAGASQAQFLPQDKLNFSSAHFQSRKSSKIHPLLPQGLTDGLVWKLPVKSEKWEVMMVGFLYSNGKYGKRG